MRLAALATAFAVVLTGAGLGAMIPGGGLPHFPATPARAYVELGPVQVLARPLPATEEAATPIAAAARARYGAVDALVSVRTEPLPGEDGGLITGVAIRWR